MAILSTSLNVISHDQTTYENSSPNTSLSSIQPQELTTKQVAKSALETLSKTLAASPKSLNSPLVTTLSSQEFSLLKKTHQVFDSHFSSFKRKPKLNISFGAIASPLKFAMDERRTLTELKDWNQTFKSLFYNEQTRFFTFVESENGLRSFQEGYTTHSALGIFIQFLSLNIITNILNDHQMDMARQLSNRYGKLKNVKQYLRSSAAQREFERMSPLGEALSQALSFYDRFQDLRTQINLPKNQVNIILQNLLKDQQAELLAGIAPSLLSLDQAFQAISKQLKTS